MIDTQIKIEEKRAEELKDRVATLTPSPHVSIIPSPHVTPIPSPHQSPITLVSTMLLQSSGPPVQIVDLGEGGSSSSESTKSDDVAKKASKVEKV